MGVPKFFRTYKHKQFNYIPIYYDPEKEEFEERVRKLEEKYGKAPEGEYKPGIQRGAMRKRGSYNAKAERGSSIRLIIIIALLLAIATYLIYM